MIFASFPEVTKVVSEAGRPDDGTDTGGFGNTEYFVGLRPKEQWRPVFHSNNYRIDHPLVRVKRVVGWRLDLTRCDYARWSVTQESWDLGRSLSWPRQGLSGDLTEENSWRSSDELQECS